MKRMLNLLMAAAVLITAAHGVTSEASPPPTDATTSARVAASFGQLPLYFVENRGQVDPRVSYYVQGSDKAIYFTDQGLTMALIGQAERWALKLDFVGARAGARPEGHGPTAATFSYFTGSHSQWRAGLKSYSQIVYRDLWPGIDLVYAGTVNRMKYTFHVQPGADPQQIRLAWHGASGVEVNGAGELAVTTPAGGFTDERPVSWQEADGRQVDVATRYRFEGKGKSAKGSSAGAAVAYGFEVGNYDRGRELVIDPAVLVYAGFLGASSSDQGNGIAVDSAGNAYVTGSTLTFGTGFPVTVGPDLTVNGGFDAFVAKVNADGTALVYAGFIGGSGSDLGRGIAVDSAGNAYITGRTTSDEASFPVTVGPDLTFNSDFSFLPEAFVAKVNAAGTALEYCGYIGGARSDEGNAIAVDAAGNAYIAGQTSTNETTFPVTVGPDLTYNGGFNDGFVAKVNAVGTALDYCGYIGGDGTAAPSGSAGDIAYGIAVDSSGSAYVTGVTDSDETSFPVTVGPNLIAGGENDGFVVKVDPSGATFLYAGFIGGADRDEGLGIAVDGAGNAYVAGVANSDEASFPVTVGPDLTHNGLSDAFVAKVDASGAAFVYSGYVGGDRSEGIDGIAVDSAGNAYVTGPTTSDETTFPVAEGPDLVYNGGDEGGDAFVAKINASGTALVYCGYVGGSGDDKGNGIAVDSAGNAYITGSTDSDETTFPVTVGPGLTASGSVDAFVAKITFVPPNAPPVAQCQSLTLSAGPGCLADASVDNASYDPDLGDTITLAQTPASPYSLGATEVTLTVTDTFGDSDSCMGTVTVVDTTAPAISCPASLTVNGSLAAGGATVSFTVTATDACDVTPAIVAVPAAGSLFPFGTTSVSATATDDSGNSTSCGFTVTVLTPQDLIGDLIAQINALVAQGALASNKANPLITKLENVSNKLDGEQLNAACNQLGAFINQLNAYIGNGTLTAAQGQALIDATHAIQASIGC